MSAQLRSEVEVSHTEAPANVVIKQGESPPSPNPQLIPNANLDIPPHRSHSPTSNAKRSSPFQFGQRYLESSDDVFAYNAWDHVDPDAAYLSYCQEQYARQRLQPVSTYDRARFNTDPAKWWDLFYKQKSSTFFKDRKWLRQEFPVLNEVARRGAGKKVVVEVGAGAGNTAFPILKANENEDLIVYAVDFSKTAVATMRASPEYNERVIRAELWDLTAPASEQHGNRANLPPGVEEGTVDVVVMIFVLSALSPAQWHPALRNIWDLLKPGGQVLFRDYGRGDLAQVRFKAGRWMADNFYVRGDGTRVYFFDKDELERLWTGKAIDDNTSNIRPRFDVIDLGVDRRLIVNRQKKIKMHRCWMQGRFRKPCSSARPNHEDNNNKPREKCYE